MNPELTKSEKKVFLLCCKGLTNQEIATALGISLNTVKTHMRSVFKKKKVKNRMALVLLSIEEKKKEEEKEKSGF